MKKITSFALAASVALAASPASAAGWTELGAQQLAMGGAGVANVQGPLAVYWNPAALGRPTENSYGLALPVDVEANVKGSVLEGTKDLNQCGNGGCTDQQVQSALNKLDHSGEGVNANVGAGADLKIGKLTVFLNAFVLAGAEPYDIDFVHDTGATASQNTSSLIVKGARIMELGAGYGHELPWTPGLYIGGDVKVMRAEVGYSQYDIVSNGNPGSNLVSTLKNNTANSGNVGVDLGALWDVDKTFDGAFWSPRLGITGRNLNNPKFDEPAQAQADGFQRFAMNPEARAGLSFSPEHWWHFAADADLTKNLTPLDGFQSQSVGAGTEIDVFNRSWINVPLRVGIKHNMASPNAGATFTAGTGVNLLHLIVDVSGEFANQSIVTQSQNGSTRIPKEVGGAVQLSFLFGGSEGRREHASAAEDQPVTTGRGEMDPVAADRVRADSDKAHQELNNQTAPSGN